MLTEAEKKWAERKERLVKGKRHFMGREELFAPWADLYNKRYLERLKKTVREAYWSRWWKIAPRDTASKQFEVYASDCKETGVAKVKHETIARFLIEAQPEYIARLIDHLEGYVDAAAFEARVAAKLVGELQYECVCLSCKYNTHGCRTARMSYNQCRLKHARLAVEAEMG